MNHEIVVAADAVRVPLSRLRVAEIARAVLRSERATPTQLSITFVGVRRIAAMNTRHLGHAGPTDVISFALSPERAVGPRVGDVYIAPDIARRNASEHGASVREELTRLVVHGVLHVLGYEHPEGEGRVSSRMWQRQEALVAAMRSRASRRSRQSHVTNSAS
jgi:probable rRNA maturation factor